VAGLANVRFAALTGKGDGTAAGYANVTGNSRVSVSLGVDQSPNPLSYIDAVVVHELGHSLGLSHPYPYNHSDIASHDRSSSPIPIEYDSTLLSVMSYYNANLASSFEKTNSNGSRSFRYKDRIPVWSFVSSFSPLDLKALEMMYGVSAREPKSMTYEIHNRIPFSYDPVSRKAIIGGSQGFSITNEIDNVTIDASHLYRPGWNFLEIWVDQGVSYPDAYRLDETSHGHSHGSLVDSWDSNNFWSPYIDADVKVVKVIGSAMNDQIWGDELGQSILGFDGHDLLSGEAGDDVIDGGIGRDHITGGLGADSFVLGLPQRKLAKEIDDANWLPVVPKVDLITDFSSVEGDKLLVSSSLLGKSSIQSSDLFIFNGRSKKSFAAASKSRSVLLYDSSNNYLLLNQNLSGSGLGSGGYIAQLLGVSSISTTDLSLV